MKKTLALILTFAMVAGCLTACGSKPEETTKAPETTTAAASKEGQTQAASDQSTTAAQAQGEGSLVDDYAKISDEEATGYVDRDTFEVGEIKEPYTIGIAVGTMGSAYFKTIPDSAQKTLESYGCKVLVADANADITTQVNQIENFITQGVDGIIVNSVDPPSAISAVLEKATEKGIPIVAVDSRLDANYKNYLGMVGSDNYQLGFACGEYMAQQLKEKKGSVEGKLCVMDGVEGNVVAQARYEGLWDGFKSVDPNHKIEEVSHLYGGSWTEEAGIQMAEDMLVANPEIDLMFGISDPFVVGATTAANRQGRDEMIMGAVDGAKSALKIIVDGGPVKVVAGQDPDGMGVIGSKMLLAYLTNKTVPENRIMKIAPRVATPDTVKDIYDENSPF